eukprot:EG_transcript_1323
MPNAAEVERLNALSVELHTEVRALRRQSQQVSATSQPVLLAELARIERQLEMVQWRLKEEHGILLPHLQERFDTQRGVFCSELVAAAYQRLDLLSGFPAASGYSPNDFSSGADTPLFLLNNAFLGPEEYIMREGRPVRLPAAPQPCHLDRQLLQKALRQTRLEGLMKDEAHLKEFLLSLTPVVLQPGQVLYSAGDFADSFYIVESGKLERLMTPPGQEGGEPEVVTTLHAGAEIGLRGLTYELPRTCTCRAVERSVLWRCDRPTFRKFLVEHVDTLVVRDYTEKRQLYYILTQHFLFKRLDRIPGPEVIDRFFNVDLKAGETLWTEGSPGDNFYVIKSGEMEVYERGRLSYVLKPGDSFGASALIFDTPRYYTIVAHTPVQCWAINSQDFHELHLAENAQHLKRAFESHCVPHGRKKVMTVEQFIAFSNAKATFPPEKYDRLARLLVALVTFNRLGRSIPNPTVPPPPLEQLRDAKGRLEEIRFFEFVRFHLTIDRPSASLAAEIAFKLLDRYQQGGVDLQSLRSFLTEVYGHDAASQQLAALAVVSPKTMAALLQAEANPLSIKEFTELYPAMPQEMRDDMELLAKQSLDFVVPALRRAEATDHPLPTHAPLLSLPAPDAGPGGHLDRRKLLLMQVTALGSVAAVAPLERLQIIRQTAAVQPGRTLAGLKLRDALRVLWREDGGLRGLTRGVSAGMFRILPAMALQYSLMEFFCQRCPPGLYQEIAYGATAGVLASALTYPFDVVRARAAVAPGLPFVLRHHVADMVRRDGTRAFFRGVVPSVAGLFPYVGANFGMYQYYVLQGNAQSLQQDRHMTPGAVVFWASMACMAHVAVMYPLDTCRRCMQVNSGCGGVWRVLRDLYATQGLRGWYAGMVPGLLKVVPAMAVGVAAWDALLPLTHRQPTLSLTLAL